MTIFHRAPDGDFLSFTQGAAEMILARATPVATSAGPDSLAAADSDPLRQFGGVHCAIAGPRRWRLAAASMSLGPPGP